MNRYYFKEVILSMNKILKFQKYSAKSATLIKI